jgi:hypothetical protein
MIQSVVVALAQIKKWFGVPTKPAIRNAWPRNQKVRSTARRLRGELEQLESRVTPSLMVATSFLDSAAYEFDAVTGALKATLVAPNSSALLSGPAGLTVGPDSNLYISSQFTNAILQYNLSTNTLSTFIPSSVLTPIAAANGDAQFAPAGLRFGPDGNLYVSLNGGQSATSGGAVVRFNISTGAGGLSTTGTSSTVATGLIQPSGLAFGTAAGDTASLYVSNSAANDVVKIANALSASPTSSTFITAGSSGMNFPSGLAWGPDGMLYVVDLGATSFQGNVLQFKPDGSFVKVVTPTGQGQPGNLLAQFPSDIVFDGQGHFLTGNLGSAFPPKLAGSINQYNADGTFDQTLVASSQFANTGPGTSGISPSQLALLTQPAPQFSITAPASTPAGTPISVTVTALDASNATMTGYAGTVHFTKTDAGPGSILPADYTFTAADKGVHVFTNGVTLVTAGSEAITATDATGISGNATITVTPLAANHFKVVAPSTAGVGNAVNFTVTALDPFNNPASGSYTGTVTFSSTDGQASLPGNAPLTGGTGVFGATLKTTGSQTITATDSAFAGITGVSAPITVGATATRFAISAPSNVTAGSPFLVTVTAQDGGGNTATGYTGTVQITSNDAQAVLPPNATLTNGVGGFLVTLKIATTIGSTVKAHDTVQPSIAGTSAPIIVGPGPASYFTATVAPGTQTTGTPFNVTLAALDQFGNIATGYAGHVHFTSSDPAASLPADATLTNGQGIVSVTLKTAGSQTITATDSTSTNPTITGSTAAITTRGLTVTSFTPIANGFTVAFSKPFVPGDITLFGPGLNTVKDVTLVGAATGAINGSLIIDPSNMTIAFKATADGLSLLNGFGSVILPDDTYTVTLLSRTGGNGFQDNLESGLDGANSGGHADYTTTFTTHFQADATPVLAVPDFARGPDDANPIKVPNDSGHGIPVTLYNASKATDVIFSLTYNPSLLNISATSSVDATDPTSTLTLVAVSTNPDGVHATASFHYQSTKADSGTVVLGDIVATVPNTAAANYKAKELLGLGGISINQGAATGVAAAGVHVNAYFGDVTGNGSIDGLDVATAGTVAQGSATGFAAFGLLDPAIVGDVAQDFSVDAGDVSDIAAVTVHIPTPVVPTIPTGLTITPIGADPTLSLGEPQRQGDTRHETRDGGTSPASGLVVAGLVTSVPVLLDDPHPAGSTGMTQAILALAYDPSVLNVSTADITLGTLPGKAGGWQLVSVVDQATGKIGIDLYSTTPIAAAQAGSLVNIVFHVLPGASAAATSVRLVSSAMAGGQQFRTQVDDDQGQLVVSTGTDSLVMQADIGATNSLARVERLVERPRMMSQRQA